MRFNFEATGIGSVPFKSAKEACRFINDRFKSIPFWPQLPRRSFLENMYVQYSETIPGLVLDEEKKTVHIDTSKVAADIEGVYSRYLDGDLEFFRISERNACGFYEFLEDLKSAPGVMKMVKGQITGPISYGLFLTDQNKRSVIYDKDLFEVLTKVLVMKARWQINRIKKVFPRVIMFIDEPYLASVGSSFVNIDMAQSAGKLDELIAAIKKEGALAGLHCCGNTDWSVLLKSAIDILSFDAYNFMKEFSLYAADIKEFLSRGGTIAWGIVPAVGESLNLTPKTLASRLKSGIALLADKGIRKETISSLITPSCGVGTLEDAGAKAVMEAVNMLSEELQ